MLTIRNLEIHVAHGCNLACESCSHYSNRGHKGLLSLAEAERWFADWSGRLAPTEFSLLGGEPTIHPQLADFVTLARRYWPNAHLRVVTNGFLLTRHPELPLRLAEAGNAKLLVSIHHQSTAYMERLRPALKLLHGWIADHSIKVGIYRSHSVWTRRYQGYGAAMIPFEDEAPRQSWEQCPARYCPQVFEGRIWKCAPLAYLGMQAVKYPLSAQWDRYLDYAPLPPDCSDEALRAFFAREEEPHCAMCPAAPETFALPFPLRNPALAQSSA